MSISKPSCVLTDALVFPLLQIFTTPDKEVKKFITFAGFFETTKKSASPMVSFILLTEPAVLIFSTSFSLFSFSQTSFVFGKISPNKNLPWFLFKKDMPSKIFFSVFSPKPNKGAILWDLADFSRVFKSLTPSF